MGESTRPDVSCESTVRNKFYKIHLGESTRPDVSVRVMHMYSDAVATAYLAINYIHYGPLWWMQTAWSQHSKVRFYF